MPFRSSKCTTLRESFRKKDEPPPPSGDRNEWVDFKGQKRSNKTHRSTTDPDARLMRKGPGQEAKLSFGLRAAMGNRSGLLVLLNLTRACGKGCTESTVAVDQMQESGMRGFEPRTVGADKGYHNSEFLQGCREMQIAPHVARIEQTQGGGPRSTGFRGGLRAAGFRHARKTKKWRKPGMQKPLSVRPGINAHGPLTGK